MRWLSTRRVRRYRRWIAENRCPERPGLTHQWRLIEAVTDSTQLAPPLEVVARECLKCGTGEWL